MLDNTVLLRQESSDEEEEDLHQKWNASCEDASVMYRI